MITEKLNQQADRVEIVYYTDPLCCWSWAFETHWQRFLQEYSAYISYQYCMSGLIPDWERFNDPLYAVSRPVQMGPVWMEVHHLTGTDINDMLWILDPPASSFPACIAVKSAGRQSNRAEEVFLGELRKAVMLEAKNIAKPEILMQIAQKAADDYPEIFDMQRFENEFNDEQSRQAFRVDLQKVRYNRIGRFPSLTITLNGRGVLITGYRPYEALVEALEQVAPEIVKARMGSF
ncbi:DsbA family protein [Dyadobacter alkalitolerans]|uniref:DsbA family protein n=1 Tax=Dyadobacter alkalitolerans TaxID=492736 RepID=UPI0003F698A3|nr:DsbA family protein [Dyadobacter alkalitolerans]